MEESIFGMRQSARAEELRNLLGFATYTDEQHPEGFRLFTTDGRPLTGAQYQKLASVLAVYRFRELVLERLGVYHRVQHSIPPRTLVVPYATDCTSGLTVRPPYSSLSFVPLSDVLVCLF